MVLSLQRILSFFDASRGGIRRLPILDLSSLSDHDLTDLNLPPELRSRVCLQRGRDSGKIRW